MHGQSRRPSAVSPQASLGPPCLNWPFSEPPLWLRSCPKAIWPPCFMPNGCWNFLSACSAPPWGWPPRRASRNSRPPKGFPALPVPTKSPRFPFPSPKSPNRLIPHRLFPLPVRPATTPRRYPAPACKSLGMVKGWSLRMENPFSKEGSPPTVPSPLPQVPCRPPLPTPSRMKSSGRRCCRSA